MAPLKLNVLMAKSAVLGLAESRLKPSLAIGVLSLEMPMKMAELSAAVVLFPVSVKEARTLFSAS